MKKLFLMIAVAGLIASCTGNGNTSGSTSTSSENKDGETTENTETPQEEKKDTVKGPTTIDNPVWTIDVPEGWYVKSEHSGENQKSSTYLELYPLVKPEGVFGLTFIKISSYPFKSNTVEQSEETFINAFKVENPKKGSETIGGVNFSKIVDPAGDKGSVTTHLCAPLTPEGNITIQIHGYELTDSVIKGMLDSFKLKPAEPEAK